MERLGMAMTKTITIMMTIMMRILVLNNEDNEKNENITLQ